jgi:hypothetical protein
MWDLNFGTWIHTGGFTVAFRGHGHPLVCFNSKIEDNMFKAISSKRKVFEANDLKYIFPM